MKSGTKGRIAVGLALAVIGTLVWAYDAQAQPFPGGIPQCQADLGTCNTELETCQTDLAACQNVVCGDGVVEGEEDCDVGTLNGETCASVGFIGGTLACGTGCTFDTSGCYAQRFVDNGDGTVTDNETGRMWVQTTNDAGLRNKDATYTWTVSGAPAGYPPDGTAFTEYLDGLNNTCGGEGNVACVADADCAAGEQCGFAGYRDWRLPEVAHDGGTAELETILLGPPICANPCIDETVFGPTAGDVYWSSVTVASDPINAWFVDFSYGEFGDVGVGGKSFGQHVRAVRTGP